MNERVREFLEKQKVVDSNKYREEKNKVLIQLGICEKEYAPLMGYGFVEGETTPIIFPITDESVKEGNVVNVDCGGTIRQVRIENITSEYSDEYPCGELDDTGVYRYYKPIPIDVSDEEYEELRRYADIKENNDGENSIASMLKIIAIVIYIVGFIASFFLSMDYGEITAMVIVWWLVFFLCGTPYLAFAEIIKLLDKISKK